MLTEEQIEHFYREGYVVVPGLVPTATVQAVKAAADSYEVKGDGWQARTFDHENPLKDKEFHPILWEPSVREAAHQLLGTEPRIYYGMVAIVPANGGNGLPWHQDNQYSLVLGGALYIFVALDTITPDMASLWVAPKSHWGGRQASRDSDLYGAGHREAAVEPENGIQLGTMQPGDTVIFDRNTYHRTLKNTTVRHRYAYAAQFSADHARMAETGKRDSRYGTIRASEQAERVAQAA